MLPLRLVNHIVLRMAKTSLSFGHSVCNMVYKYTHYCFEMKLEQSTKSFNR